MVEWMIDLILYLLLLVDPNYTPFQKEKKLDIKENINLLQNNFKPFDNLPNQDDFSDNSYLFLQLGTRYIITIKKNGLLIIDVFRAQQQIKFEELIERYKNGEVSSQRLLHPREVSEKSS